MKKSQSYLSIDYYAYRSPLRNIHAGFRVMSLLLVLVCCLVFGEVLVSLYVLLTMAGLTILAGKIPGRLYLHLLWIPAVFILLGCAAIAVEPAFTDHGLKFLVTRESMRRCIQVLTRSFACVSVLFALSLSTPVSELVSVLKQAGVPKLLIELMYLIYRYIFILLDTWQRIWNAAESRLGFSGRKTAFGTFGSAVASLFFLSMDRAGKHYDAMESRCYQGELGFLESSGSLRLSYGLGVLCYLAVLAAVYVYGKEITGV